MDSDTAPATRETPGERIDRRGNLTPEQVEFAVALGRVLAHVWASRRSGGSDSGTGRAHEFHVSRQSSRT
jgi:hypothetical protein